MEDHQRYAKWTTVLGRLLPRVASRRGKFFASEFLGIMGRTDGKVVHQGWDGKRTLTRSFNEQLFGAMRIQKVTLLAWQACKVRFRPLFGGLYESPHRSLRGRIR